MPKLTIAIMDGPYESETSTTIMRIVDAALKKGHSVNIFAYEGAVSLSLKGQTQHPNPVKMTSVEQQDHPTTAKLIQGLFKMSDGRLNWINCGMCVDERGATDWVEGPKRGGPGDLYKWTLESTNTLVIGTR